jgi:hypothetical protein
MKFRLAQPEDDFQLRKLMRENVMPGHIRMIYAREPSFFAGFAGNEESTEVIVLEDKGRIAGIGCRSIRNLFINGKPQAFGYLSGLRLLPEIRNGTALARGYAFLRKLHADQRCTAYLTTLVEGNLTAEKVLTGQRAGLPAYIPAGRYNTRVCPVRQKPGHYRKRHPFRVTHGEHVSEEHVREFLLREGRRRQFFPVCGDPGEYGPDLIAEIGLRNLMVVTEDGEVKGVMGLWDRNAVRQYVVHGYSTWLRIGRPCLNLALRCGGFHGLPPAGGKQHIGFVALVCIANDDAEVFQCLFRAVCRNASAKGIRQVIIGMHEDDPLNDAVRAPLHITYRSRLYLVSWDHASLDEVLAGDSDRTPYLETGSL